MIGPTFDAAISAAGPLSVGENRPGAAGRQASQVMDMRRARRGIPRCPRVLRSGYALGGSGGPRSTCVLRRLRSGIYDVGTGTENGDSRRVNPSKGRSPPRAHAAALPRYCGAVKITSFARHLSRPLRCNEARTTTGHHATGRRCDACGLGTKALVRANNNERSPTRMTTKTRCAVRPLPRRG